MVYLEQKAIPGTHCDFSWQFVPPWEASVSIYRYTANYFSLHAFSLLLLGMLERNSRLRLRVSLPALLPMAANPPVWRTQICPREVNHTELLDGWGWNGPLQITSTPLIMQVQLEQAFWPFNGCPFVLLLDTPDKSLAPSSWQPPLRYLHAFSRFLLVLLLTTDVHSCHLHGRRDDPAPLMLCIFLIAHQGSNFTKIKYRFQQSLYLSLWLLSIYYFFLCLSPSLMVSGSVKVLSDKRNSWTCFLQFSESKALLCETVFSRNTISTQPPTGANEGSDVF